MRCDQYRHTRNLFKYRTFEFLTNHFTLPAYTITELTAIAGRLSCSSSGSNNTCASNGASENAVTAISLLTNL